MSKKTTKTDYSQLAPKTERKLTKKQKNLLGYLQYRYIGYSKQRMENDDWFFISDREFMEETGIGSFTTLHVFLSSFIMDGIIEKRTGDRHRSNQYRFTEAYRNSSFDYVPVMEKCSTKVVENVIVEGKSVAPTNETVAPTIFPTQNVAQKCSTKHVDFERENEKSVAPTNETVAPTIFPTQNVAQKCSTKHVDFERENEKSVAPHGKQKCSTDKDKDKDKELSKVTYLLRDCHQREPDRINNNPLGIYVDDNTPDIPEWMNELKPVEPFEQYTDDIQGEAMQETENEPLQDEETDPDDPQENKTSKLAVLSDERGGRGTTTHRQAESLSNGEKTTSTGATDPVTDNVNNNLNNDTQNMTVTERKEKQAELSRKWENFKLQVPQMHRADAEMYFKRFLNKVSEYYTGTHINTTQDRFKREFKQLKPLADWSEQEAAQDIENWISQGFNTETIKRYVKQKYGEAHDEFVMQKRQEHYSRPIKVTPEYAEWEKNPVGPAPLPF